MIMADVLRWTLALVASYLTIVCYWLLSASLFPDHVGKCQQCYTGRPLRATLTGMLTFIPLLFLAGALGKVPHPLVQICALVLALSCLLIALIGSAGLARRVGEGLPSARDVREPWRRIWRGGLVLALTFFLPFIGTFLVLPLTLMAGFGAFLLSLPRRSVTRAPAPASATPPPIPRPTTQP